MESDMENVIDITNKFLDQIQALFIMAEKEVVRKPLSEEKPSLDSLFEFILHYKSLQIKSEKVEIGDSDEKLTTEDTEFLLSVEEDLPKNKILKHVVDNIDIIEEEDSFRIKTTSPLTSLMSDKYSNSRRYYNTEDDIYLNSLIMSLVTSFELLVSDLIKDYALSNKNPNFFNNEKLDYKTLVQIGDVDTAKEYLIDRYLEKVLRDSVKVWLKELESISNKINFRELSDYSELLIETFERRHLLVHNNGIVNNLYISNVDSSLTSNIVKDAQLETTREYIEHRINIFREIGILLSYKYFTAIYSDKKDEIYNTYQEHIIHRIPRDCKASEAIFQMVMKDNKYPETTKLLAKINYWLIKKFNSTFQEVEEDVMKFDIETLKPEFQMAKYLLLDDQDSGFDKFIEFSRGMEDYQLFYTFEWPILKLLDGYEPFSEFRRNIMDSLVGEEEETLIEQS